MRFRLISCLFVLASPAAALAAADTVFVGHLDKRLVADPAVFNMVILQPLEAAKAPVPLAGGERAWSGAAAPWPGAQPLPLVLIDSAQGQALALFYDRNRDGKLTPEERASFPATAPKDEQLALELRLPLKGGPFPDYPLVFGSFQEKVSIAGMPEDIRALTQSKTSFAYGKVDVQGRTVAVRYAVTPGKDLDPLGEQGVDGDGDGKFGGRETPETDGGQAGLVEPPLFPVGSLFLSTAKLDAATGRIEMVSHPASDYRRIRLAVGAQMPDFSFTDYAGQPHKLSELKGKTVLLDFWATWCAPCLAEFPRLKEAYAAHRDQGFEVVTVAWRDKAEKSGKRAEAEGLPWLQGTAESTEELATQGLRLQSIPFTILLDREGKIVSTGGAGQLALRGDALKATLAKLLPAAAAAPVRR